MHVLLLAVLAIFFGFPAQAQRSGPHDGSYDGFRAQECRRTGRTGQQRVVAELHGSTMTIPGMLGDAPIEATVSPTGAVALPRLGLFGEGTGQIFEGPNNARRFTGTHPGRGECQMVYDLRRRQVETRR
ncbi:MAG: hypothetical protein JWR10_2570 [Rubritepida sp.]|nr:hypothetical protein [Rubritepida sp.]